MRAVYAMEVEAALQLQLQQTVVAPAPGIRTKHHQSLTPAAAKVLGRLVPVGQPLGYLDRSGGSALGRPELHTRSRSYDILSATPAPPFLRDRSSSHPNIGEEIGYAV